MAITERDTPALSDLARQNESVGEAGGDTVSEDATKKDESTVPSLPSSESQQQQQAPNRPSLVPLGSSQSTTTHKKFSAVNIGKKFLEKNAQSAAAASTTSSNTSGAKTSAATVRPVAQTAPSHSRLVTAKLTVTPFATSPAGWSRPSSVAPPASTPGNNSAAGTPPASNSKAASPAPPALGQQKESGKPVWGNVKPTAPVRADIRQDDFPTAAEAVKGATKSKPEDKPDEKPETAKQAATRVEDADTFRGVHLDPNAHHWDEMEEDDDDFLGGVVEFGDGRQYKVEAVDETKVETPNLQDRFADDFDRSWPKSRSSPASSNREVAPPPVPTTNNEPTRSPAFSSSGLHSASPRGEPPRVLFNERSNRLEPYSHGRPGPPPPQGRPNDSSGQPVRVLHKPPPGPEPAPRSRRFSGASATSSSAMPSPRESTFFGGGRRGDGPPPSPRLHREPMVPTRSFNGRERGAMGPPPVPAHALKVANAAGRPLPPHMAQAAENQPPARPNLTPVNTNSSIPPASPKAAAGPLTAATPSIADASPIVPPSVDVDEARKELMHTAATRAKQRREQEEAEREAQKERARKKAQEIEEKMKALQEEKAKQEKPAEAAKVEAVIQDAVKSVSPGTPTVPQRPPMDGTGPKSFSRPGGFAADGPHPPRRTSFFGPKESPPAGQEPTSWRTKTGPPTPISPPPAIAAKVQPARRPSSSGFVASTTVALDSAVDGVKEDLEVVDFSDMAKLVNGEEKPEVESSSPQQEAGEPIVARRAPRAVASDFFEDDSSASPAAPTEASKPAEKPPVENAWRRKPVIVPGEKGKEEAQVEAQPLVPVAPASQTAQPAAVVPAGGNKQPPPPLEQTGGRPAIDSPTAPPRTPRSQSSYKDASLSSLDHAMSRIKGAMKMDGPKEPVQGDGPAPMKSSLKPIQRDRWVPPALRPKTVNFVDEEHHEVFAVTAEEPSFSPLPSDSQPSVSLPKISTRRDFVNRKQLLAFTRAPLAPRYDILSFDPPVEGMRRDFNLNFILFRRPPIVKGQIKPRVCIPRWRGPRVYAPGKLNGTGSFSKATVADGVSSWRKPAVSPAAEEACAGPSFDTGLETQSRSPPPELVIPPSTTASTSKPSEPTPTKSEGSSVLRPRSQPKMPAGSAVAFRRDSRIDVADENIKPSVNFIVSDELEETADAPKDEPQPAPEPQPSPGQLSTVPPDATSSTAPGPSPQPGSNPESKANESSGDRASQPSPWSRPSVNLPVKDSSARGPDPEHLKALWSQKSDKREQLQPVNSLEGIADDLTPIPFTFPEVKSESGSTPPLNGPQAPSRMSLHDVTRAFQTVPQPSASNNAPARPAISPPSTNAPVARPTPAITTVNASAPPNPGYSYVPMPPNGRPVYGSYPSPLMSHSPAPGMVYSPHPHPMGGSPVPARMAVNPQHSLYGWMPVPGHGSPAPNGPMRSPYPAQLMAYGTPPGGAPVPYPQPVPPMQRQPMPNGAQGNRNHNSAISPIMSHAPVYHSSPMMVHSPLAPHQNHAAYMPNGRGQPRADNSNNGMNGPQPHPQQQQQHMPPHMMYPPNPHAQSGPSQPYARTW